MLVKHESILKHENIKASIEEIGKWLIENADNLALNVKGKRSMSINVDFDFTLEQLSPEISLMYDLIDHKAVNELYFPEREKGEK